KFAEIGKVFDIGFDLLERFVVDARDEAHVVISGQNPMNASGQSNRPRHAHGLFDDPAGRQFDAAEEADQRRFAGAVTSQQRKLFTLRNSEGYTTENAVNSSLG